MSHRVRLGVVIVGPGSPCRQGLTYLRRTNPGARARERQDILRYLNMACPVTRVVYRCTGALGRREVECGVTATLW